MERWTFYHQDSTPSAVGGWDSAGRTYGYRRLAEGEVPPRLRGVDFWVPTKDRDALSLDLDDFVQATTKDEVHEELLSRYASDVPGASRVLCIDNYVGGVFGAYPLPFVPEDVVRSCAGTKSYRAIRDLVATHGPMMLHNNCVMVLIGNPPGRYRKSIDSGKLTLLNDADLVVTRYHLGGHGLVKVNESAAKARLTKLRKAQAENAKREAEYAKQQAEREAAQALRRREDGAVSGLKGAAQLAFSAICNSISAALSPSSDPASSAGCPLKIDKDYYARIDTAFFAAAKLHDRVCGKGSHRKLPRVRELLKFPLKEIDALGPDLVIRRASELSGIEQWIRAEKAKRSRKKKATVPCTATS